MQHQVQAFHHWQISGEVVQLFPAKGPLAASALPPKLLTQHPWIDDHGDCGLGVLFIYSNVFEFEDVRFLFFFFFFFKTPFLPRFEHGMICPTTATPVEERLHKGDHMRSWARRRPCVIHCHRCALPLQKCLRKRVCDIVTPCHTCTMRAIKWK